MADADESSLDRPTPAGRGRHVIVFMFVLGLVAGGGAIWWWTDRPSEEPAPVAVDNSVRLVLTGEVERRPPTGDDATGALWIDGALLHSRGAGTAVVTRIHRAGGTLAIRVPALPVKLSVNHSFERIRLQVTPRDCVLATQWTPSSQPFSLTWFDDQGDVHEDLGGDHDSSMEISLIRHLAAVCDTRNTQ